MSSKEETRVSAVILDLDGTLLNTEQATKGVLGELLERYGKVVDRNKENKRLGMIHKEYTVAIVEDYQLPITPENFSKEIMPLYYEKWANAKALPGADRIMQHLHKHKVPFALASNSVRKNVDTKISHHKGWRERFSVILGSDQVKSGKPSPDLFLEAAKQMGADASNCIVIEDSLVGVKAAKAARMKAVAVPSIPNAADQYSIADIVLNSLLEFQPELWGLPPFEDWVDDALPIEPFRIKGWYNNGLLCQYGDGEDSILPDQVVGMYFGWVRFDTHEVYKVVTCIGWEHSCCTSKRKIRLHLLDAKSDATCDQNMQVLVVGYIRGLSKEESRCSDVEVPEEDRSIARRSLNLPIFNHHMRW